MEIRNCLLSKHINSDQVQFDLLGEKRCKNQLRILKLCKRSVQLEDNRKQ